jgi:hypothetical protein
MGMGASNQVHRTWITGHNRIGGEKQDPFDHRLGHKNPIKRILVNGGKGLNFHRVHTHDREFRIAIVEEATPQEPRINPEVRTIKTPLDGDLP